MALSCCYLPLRKTNCLFFLSQHTCTSTFSPFVSEAFTQGGIGVGGCVSCSRLSFCLSFCLPFSLCEYHLGTWAALHDLREWGLVSIRDMVGTHPKCNTSMSHTQMHTCSEYGNLIVR